MQMRDQIFRRFAIGSSPMVQAGRIILFGVGNTEQFFCGEIFQFDGDRHWLQGASLRLEKTKRNTLKAARVFCCRLNWLHPPLRYIVCTLGIYTYLLHREKKDKEEARKGAAMARAK
jgi:hypothetical protein